jgi:tRNA-dihydrouridine synthase 1
MLTRSYMPDSSQLLAYTPMFHARIFSGENRYRKESFPPAADASPQKDAQEPVEARDQLDGNAKLDRPLFVQFCANDADILLQAARRVQPYCDAVDLNLGCPQGIAKKGNYGAFLQEDPDLIYRLINTLHKGLDIPVTAKMRVLETREKTLNYAKMILSAGASIITVHGRRREQKGHNTGLADWSMIRYLRQNLPPETVIFANGNILQHGDIQRSLDATGADAVMSAEGNLHDPTIFAPPPGFGEEPAGYWRDRSGKGGYRMDSVLRRYLDIVYKYAFDQAPPERPPLFISSSDALDGLPTLQELIESLTPGKQEKKDKKAAKKAGQLEKRERQKKLQKLEVYSVATLAGMQGHLFDLLRPLLQQHTRIRGALATCYRGDMQAYENVLSLVEAAVREGIVEYEKEHGAFDPQSVAGKTEESPSPIFDDDQSSKGAIERSFRQWWICQPYVRPMPKESFEIGAMTVSKKNKKHLADRPEEAASLDEPTKRPRLDMSQPTRDDQLVAG